MRSPAGAVVFDRLEASVLDAQGRLLKAQDSQIAEANRSRRPCTHEAGDVMMLSTEAQLEMMLATFPDRCFGSRSRSYPTCCEIEDQGCQFT